MCFTVNLLKSEGRDRCCGFHCNTTSETVTTGKLTLAKVDLKSRFVRYFFELCKGQNRYIISLTKHKKVSRSEKQQWLQKVCRSYVVISFDFAQQDEVVNSLDEKGAKVLTVMAKHKLSTCEISPNEDKRLLCVDVLWLWIYRGQRAYSIVARSRIMWFLSAYNITLGRNIAYSELKLTEMNIANLLWKLKVRADTVWGW